MWVSLSIATDRCLTEANTKPDRQLTFVVRQFWHLVYRLHVVLCVRNAKSGRKVEGLHQFAKHEVMLNHAEIGQRLLANFESQKRGHGFCP